MPTPKIRRILAAMGPEEGPDEALLAAGRLAWLTGAELLVLRAPFPAVAEAAADRACDLVVLGPYHARSLVECMRDTTGERVVRCLDAPCLVVGPGGWRPHRRVLLPVDLSDSPGRVLDVALDWLGALAAALGGPEPEVHVLSVVPEFLDDPGLPLGREGVRHHLDGLLACFRDRFAALGVRMEASLAVADAVAPEIERVADGDGTDLVVLATHGRHSVARVLLGSVCGPSRRSARPLLILPQSIWSPRHEAEAALAGAGAG